MSKRLMGVIIQSTDTGDLNWKSVLNIHIQFFWILENDLFSFLFCVFFLILVVFTQNFKAVSKTSLLFCLNVICILENEIIWTEFTRRSGKRTPKKLLGISSSQAC